MRSLFGKIFLWFWLAMTVLTVASLVLSFLLTGTPLLRQWLVNYTELYAEAAVRTYLLEGHAGLAKYVASLRISREADTVMLGPRGEVVYGDNLRPLEQELLERVQVSGHAECQVRLAWTCATVVSTEQGKYSIAVRVVRPRRMMRGFPPFAGGTRALALIGCAGLLCWLLARYIARPVKVLQTAARRLAAGDLSVRVAPQLAPRKDELVDLAEEFDRMAERIEGLLRSQRQMLGDISHELRSPLTRLGVALELAQDGDRETLSRMHGDLDKLDELIEQILTLNRLDTGEKWIELESTNLETVLTEVVRDANLEGRTRGVTVELRTEPIKLDANAALLKSCVENVVRNALRYAPEKTGVEVHAYRNGGDAVITVGDRGPGVPVEALPRLFEPFYRVAESRSEKSGGRGLGLSISERAARVHGGSIQARNREGGGLEIEIRLRLQRSTTV